MKTQHAGTRPVSVVDPEVYNLVMEESHRQVHGIELIASENFTSRAVMEVLGSCLTNKYSEGLPGARYYGGNEVIDKIEGLCQKRALETYRLNPENWGVNVQPYSGSPANFAAFTGLLKPHDRIMGLDLPSGGHLSHGYYTAKIKVSAPAMYFESLPYKLHPETGLIDMDKLEENAQLFRPKLIICGGSAYPREWDYARFRKIADSVGAILLCDMAHISGLVATQEAANPFDYADVVTSTTHKSLRGPRAGMIFFRRGPIAGKEGQNYDYENRINQAVFPGCQGGPHEHQIGALAVAFLEAQSPDFKVYQQQVKKNAAVLSEELIKLGYKIVTGGTVNHLVLWDLRPAGLTGSKMEKLLELVSISLNKNTVLGDTSALSPGGVRIGTPAMTTRGLKEEEFKQVAQFLHRAVQIALRIQAQTGKPLKDFVAALPGNAELAQLKSEVEAFSSQFPMPGVPTDKFQAVEN